MASQEEQEALQKLLQNEQEELFEEPEEDKLQPLQKELDLIHSPEIRTFLKTVLSKADHFWETPAGSVHENHPHDELDPGGMVLHTKRVFRITLMLCMVFDLTIEEIDYTLAAALLHDTTKIVALDEEDGRGYYDTMHPYTVQGLVELVTDGSQFQSIAAEVNQILRIVRCQKGKWSPVPETLPDTEPEMILHLADHLAGHLTYIVDGSDVREERWLIDSD